MKFLYVGRVLSDPILEYNIFMLVFSFNHVKTCEISLDCVKFWNCDILSLEREEFTWNWIKH